MNIKNIAEQAGVSASTVSRVMNGKPGISSPTIARIQRIAEEMGYIHRPNKTSFNKNLTFAFMSVGFDFRDMMNSSVFPSILHGIEQAFASAGHQLAFSHVDDTLPPLLANGNVAGVIAMGHPPDGSLLLQMNRWKQVWISPTHIDPPAIQVTHDDYVAGRLAADYLDRKKHKRVAFLNAVTAHTGCEMRGHAFVQTCREKSMQVEVFQTDKYSSMSTCGHDIDRACIDRFLRRIANKDSSMTAVFVASDMVTAHLYPELISRGIRPVTDLDIISCDNDTIIKTLIPKPVTIDIHAERIGRKAVQLLLCGINEPGLLEEGMKVLIRPHIVMP